MLLARSMQEAQLFVELRGCGCGSGQAMVEHELHQRGDELVARFTDTCQSCGAQQVYELALSAKQVRPPSFGGPDSSLIVDPGEFLWTSDQAAAQVPVDISRLDQVQRKAAMASLQYAMAALDEVVKFVPVGADRVPVEAFVSELGQAMYRANPGRFTVTELEEQAASYLAGLADL
ncbi:hypothetical protein [Micromonospora lupini]|uniref:hypothetical protein n=1 Tax=Micromonospora lupini TaxID=285679 RepID=UPI0031D1FC71